MKIFSLLAIFVFGWSDVLTINVPAPEYELEGSSIGQRGQAYTFGTAANRCK